jgi:site-specific DNA recombinase
MRRAIVFARVSSREQEETGYSLDAQVKLLNDYAGRHELDVVKTWRVSESASGKQVRKVFNEMLQYVSQHNIPVILVEKIDRLTRNLKDASAVDEWARGRTEREVHFNKESFILNSGTRAHENLVWDMKVAIARFYANNLSEEVKKGQKEKLAQGWMPMRAKLGYKSVGEKGRKTHEIDEAVAPLMRQMFELYSTGNHSIKSILDTMTKAGLRNEFGKKISRSRLHEMLSDPFYCGEIVWMDQTYKGKHEPIISKELFAVVQRKLGGKFKNPQHQKHLPVFKGKIECEECGSTIAWGIQKGHWYGYCNHHKACSQKGCTRQEKVEDQVIPAMNAVAPRTKRALEWLEGALKESHAGEIAFNTARRDELTRVIKTADQRMESAYRDKLDHKMPADLCSKIIDESTEEKKDALEALEKLTDSRQAYYEAGYAIHELAMHAEAIYRSPKALTEEQRLLLSYGFSNLTLKAHEIRPEYTLAFQFLKEWMPVVNKIFEPTKNPAITKTTGLSGKEKTSLRAWADAFQTFDWEKAIPVPELAVKQIGQLLALANRSEPSIRMAA